jgi:hypothetical protein
MIKRISCYFFLSALLAVGAAQVSAQVIPSPYRFVETRQEWGVFVGTGSANTGQLGIGPKSGTLIGGRYLLEFASAFGLEVSSTLLYSSRDVFDPRRDTGDEIIGEAQIDVATLDLRLKFNLTGHRTWHRLQPFILLGGGLAFEALKDRTVETTAGFLEADVYNFGTRFKATAGGGVSLHLSDRFILRADGLLRLWKVSTPDGFLDASRIIPLDRTLIPPDEWVALKSLSISLGWRR